MNQIQTNKQIGGKDFPIGSKSRKVRGTLRRRLYPTGKSGRWTVPSLGMTRREETRFVVVFHRCHDRPGIFLAESPATDQGEMDAKTCAIPARDANQITPFTTGA